MNKNENEIKMKCKLTFYPYKINATFFTVHMIYRRK